MEEESIPWPWIADYTEEGSVYYINQENGEQVWEIPSDGYEQSGNYYLTEHGEEEYQDEWTEDLAAYSGENYYDEGWGDSTNDYGSLVASPEVPGNDLNSQSSNAWGAATTSVSSNKEIEISYKVVQTPLFEACEKHDEEAVISILETLHHSISITQVVNQMNPAGMTALHVCCLFGSEKCALVLIANKADVHAVDKFGSGCMHYISRSRVPSPTLLRLLICKGCDVYFEEKLAHYTAREELVLEQMFLRASPSVWEQRLENFDASCPDIDNTISDTVSPSLMASMPLPLGWEKLEDDLGTFFYCERTDTSVRERPKGTSPRGEYEVLLSNFTAYLIKCLPWYGGKGVTVKSGPLDYAEDDQLWDDRARVKVKVISALHTDKENDVETEENELTATQRRILECYCILRREEIRVTEAVRGKSVKIVPLGDHIIKRPKKPVLLGLCGYWNPLVAMKVIALLIDSINTNFIISQNKSTSVEGPVSSSASGKSVAASKQGVGNLATVKTSTDQPHLPVDYEVASTEYDLRCKRLIQLAKAEKTYKRLQSEGKADSDQSKKLKKDISKLKEAFDGAHQAWISRIAVEVLPKRVALCENELRRMGFSLPAVELIKNPKVPKTPSSPSRRQSHNPKKKAEVGEGGVSLQAEESTSAEPMMPLDTWTPNDVAWAVSRRLPQSATGYDRTTIMIAIRDMEISGKTLFPQTSTTEVVDEGDGDAADGEGQSDEHSKHNSAYPTLSSNEKVRLDYLVETLNLDNKMKQIWVSTVFRSLLLKSKRWSQMNITNQWQAPNPVQDEDGRLLEHVIGRIGKLMVSEEGSLQQLAMRLKQKEMEASSTTSSSNFSFLDIVHAKEAKILEQHVAYQKEQRSLLHDAMERFKNALLPLPPEVSSHLGQSAGSPPASPERVTSPKHSPKSPPTNIVKSTE